MNVLKYLPLKRIKPVALLIGLFFLVIPAISQNQDSADSLKYYLNNKALSGSERIITLRLLLSNEQNRDSIVHYGKLYLELALSRGDNDHVYSAYIFLGGAYEEKGSLELALENYIHSLKYANSSDRKGTSYANIGTVYTTNKDSLRAFENYLKAIGIFKSIPDSLRIGTSSISLGYSYYKYSILDSSEYYLDLAKNIFENKNIPYNFYYLAYANGNRALVKAKLGEFDMAENLLNSAIETLIEYQDNYAICDFDLQLAKIYFDRGEVLRGIAKAESSFLRASNSGFKQFIRDGAEVLSQFHSELGNYEKAYSYQSTFISYKDSLLNADLIRKLADQQKEYEVNQKQSELDVITAEQKAERVILWATAGFAFVLFILAFTIFKYYRAKSKVNQILEAQKVELESLNSTKDKFFSIISHDLRGPISSFFGISRMIKFFVKSKETDQLLEVADDIDQSVEQLSKLLDNLLSWAVQQQGGFPNNPEKLKLSEVSDSILGTFSTMAQGKNISLTAKIREGLEIWADRKMVETIFRNLVNNALKFTPEKGQVTIEAMREGNQSHIQIIDTGVGIPQDRLDELFKLQAKKSTYGTSGEKGLGLGLQLAYEFVASNNGKMEVESKEGEGTVFHVYFPLHHSSNGMN